MLLIFGEVVPKSVYQQEANRLAPRIIFPLRFFSLLFYPLVFVFSHLARLVVRLTGVKASHESLFVTREKVRMMLEGAEQAANVDVFDRDRLIRAVRFADKTVGEVIALPSRPSQRKESRPSLRNRYRRSKPGCWVPPQFNSLDIGGPY